MKHVKVTVVDSGGSPKSDIKVSIYVHQFAAQGMTEPQYTDRDGEANFKLNIDEYAEISVYVKGDEAIKRGSVKAEYICKI